MNRIHLITIAAVYIQLLALDPSRAESAEIVGKIVTSNGTVIIKKEGSDEAPRSVRSGDPIYEGDVINTSSSASVKLLLSDRTVVDVGPSTLFSLKEFKNKNVSDRKVELEMPYGKVRTNITKPVGNGGTFNIRTQTATMGVRGTEIIIQAELKMTQLGANKQAEAMPTQITLVSGSLQVNTPSAAASGGSQEIKMEAGQKLSTASIAAAGVAGAPQVAQVSRSEMQMAKNEATHQDQTFSQTVNLEPKDGNGDRTGGGNQERAPAGEGKGAAIGEIVAAVAERVQTVANLPPPPIHIPGTFGPNFMNNLPLDVPTGAPVGIKVIFKR